MKYLLILLVSISAYSQATLPWKGLPKAVSLGLSDSCYVRQGSILKRIPCSLFAGSGVSIDTTKVGRIEQGRGSAPIFMYFNGTSWVRNDTSYIPRSGASNITGNLKSNQSFFEMGLASGNNNVQFSDGVYTKFISSNGSNITGVLQSYSTGLGYSQVGVSNSTSGYSRVLTVNGSSTTTPDLSFKFDKGIAWYNGDYSAEMETSQNLIPSLKKVKQLISDSLSSGGGGSTNASNGLSLAGDTVKLGGTLNDTTIINTNNNTLTLAALSTDANKVVLRVTSDGYSILDVNNLGADNISLGLDAGISKVSGSNSLILGRGAAPFATTISYATVIGQYAANTCSSITESVVIGTSSGVGNVSESTITGFSAGIVDNSVVSTTNLYGAGAGYSSKGFYDCNIMGYYGAANLSNAVLLRNSILIGNYTATSDNVNTTGGGIIHIGNYTHTGGFNNTIAIGDSATNTKTNQVVFAPKYRHLRLRGVDYELPSSQGGVDTYLKNNGSGVLSWATVSGGGSGTVTSVSVTTANGVSGTVATSTTTPAISLTLGAITPTSVNGVTLSGSSTPSITVVGSSSLAGSNTGDQTSVTGNAGTATSLQTSRLIGIATGDVTSSGASFNGTANNTNIHTLATVNSNVGTFGSSTQTPTFVVNGKGLITSVSNTTVTPAIGSITGLGTGVATWLETPSSANLQTAITDETGTGVAVFGTSPTFTTDITAPVIIGGTGTTSQLILRSTSGAGTTGSDIIFQNQTNGSNEPMRILSSGNVGIGTATPDVPLVVSNSSSASFVGIARFLAPNNTTSGNASSLTIGVANTTNNAAQLRFHYNGSGSAANRLDLGFSGSANAVVSVLADGNLGIGTSNPQSRLSVTSGLAVGSTYAGTNAAPTDGAIIQGNVGIGTTSPTNAKLQVRSTTEQLRLEYDASNYATFTTSSSGALTIAPTNANFNVTGNIYGSGQFSTNGSGLVTANLATGSGGSLAGNTTTSQVQLIGSSNLSYRVLERGSTGGTVGVGYSYASHIIGTQAATVAASGSHPIFAQLAIKPLTVTTGSGTLSATSTLYVEGAATNGTNNYALWVDAGNSRFDAPVILGSYTVSTLPTGVVGMNAYVTDALTPTYLVAVVGGGSVVTPVFYNGSAWVAH